MKKVYTFIPLNEKHKKQIELAGIGCEFKHFGKEKPTIEQIQDANIIIGNVNPNLLKHCPNLEFVQLNSAGTNGYTDEGVLSEKVQLANASGAYGIAISECMITGLLSLMKHMPAYLKNQENHQWKDEGKVHSIYNSNTLVIGLGNLGTEFAKRMHALGSHVTAVKRTIIETPEYIDSIHTIDELDSLIEKADIIACTLPGSNQTYHLFDKARLQHVKKGTYFINVGRGTLIDTELLATALNNEVFAGAYVDVTDPEPLPSQSNLWDAKNCIITPHVTGGYHLDETLNRIISICCENLRHVCLNEEIINKIRLK